MNLDLTDKNTLKTTMGICIVIYTILTFITNYILRKKGVNIYSTKNTLIIGLAFSPILIWYVWIMPMKAPIVDPIIARVILSIFSAALGIVLIYANRYGGMGYRRHIGFETAEDKRVWAAEEQAKKEKEEKQKARDLIKYGKQGPPSFIIFLRKYLWLIRISIFYIPIGIAILFSFKYPYNVVFSVVILSFPVIYYLENRYLKNRHNEKKEKREGKGDRLL